MKWGRKIRRALRSRARRIAVESLCRLARTDQKWRRPDGVPKVQILLMHELLATEQGRFRDLLRQLADRYRFIGYSEAVRRIVTGDIDRSYLAFSFDDGLHGCWPAANILEEFGVRGMFFICPGIIEADKAVQAQICREVLWMEPAPFLSWGEIEELSNRGHEFGSHTLHHVFSNRIGWEELMEELAGSKDALQKRLGTCEHFAWPYGRFSHFNEQAQRLVTRVGFVSCASGERGSHAPHADMPNILPCIRRESIEVGWPARHVKYFLNRSSQSPLRPCNCWPPEWQQISSHAGVSAHWAA